MPACGLTQGCTLLVQAIAEGHVSRIMQVLGPQRRVLFLDTDGADGREDDMDGGTCNSIEADLLMQIVGGMGKAAVPLEDICLVSPYRAQVILHDEDIALRRAFLQGGR